MAVYVNGEKIGVVRDVLAGGYDVESVVLEDGTQELQITEIGGIQANRKWASLVDGSITTLTEDDFNGVTKIRPYVFSSCLRLANVVLPDGVTSIGDYAFYGCSKLTDIKISSSVTSVGYFAFEYCHELSSVTFGENSQLTSIGNRAFESCGSLTSIEIPSSVTLIGNEAFSGCGALRKVKFKSTTPPTIRDRTFSDSSITTIAVPTGCLEVYRNATNYESLASLMVEED